GRPNDCPIGWEDIDAVGDRPRYSGGCFRDSGCGRRKRASDVRYRFGKRTGEHARGAVNAFDVGEDVGLELRALARWNLDSGLERGKRWQRDRASSNQTDGEGYRDKGAEELNPSARGSAAAGRLQWERTPRDSADFHPSTSRS